MTKKEKYQISFQKQTTTDNWIFNFATTDNIEHGDIAVHLTGSDKFHTDAQIDAITKEQNGSASDFFWGEVFGSPLYFHSNNTLEVGDGETILPTEDFKGLLQEWLEFISQ